MAIDDSQKLIFDWFNEHHPTWYADLMQADFDGFQSLPIELKMVPALFALEHNIINGGWSQFLWNCFGTWREIIQIAREAFLFIAASGEQQEALDQLFAHCEQHKKECEQAIAIEDGSMESFANFTKHRHMKEGEAWEMLLWSGTDVYWQRLDWLSENAEHIKKLLADIDVC